jgi:hypothetical protein
VPHLLDVFKVKGICDVLFNQILHGDFLLAFSMNPVPKTSWCINAKSIFKWRESLEIGTIANKSRKSFCGWIRRRTL